MMVDVDRGGSRSQPWEAHCAQSALNCWTAHVTCRLWNAVISSMPTVSLRGSARAWHVHSVDRRSPKPPSSTNCSSRGRTAMIPSLPSLTRQSSCRDCQPGWRRRRANCVCAIANWLNFPSKSQWLTNAWRRRRANCVCAIANWLNLTKASGCVLF